MNGKSKDIIRTVRKILIPKGKRIQVVECGVKKYLLVTRKGVGAIHTPYGYFWQYDFHVNDEWEKYSVLVRASLNGQFNPVFTRKNLLLRIDSGCETGQLFHDNTCECREQLHLALQRIDEYGEGIIVHIPSQDGRGGGLAFKLATLLLEKDLGMDTIEAARVLTDGGEIDFRTYGGVVGILKFFRAQKEVFLMTNNPLKISALTENKYKISRLNIVVPPTRFTARHLRAKEQELGHMLS